MDDGLFRQEAIAHLGTRRYGMASVSQPLSTRILGLVVIGTVLLGLTLLSLGEYRRKETVRGVLSPAAGMYRITSPIDGTVSNLDVANGEYVRKGTPLVTVTRQVTPDGGPGFHVGQLARLGQQYAMFEADLAQLDVTAGTRKAEATTHLDVARRSLNALDLRRRLQQRTLAMLTRQVASFLPLVEAGRETRTSLDALERQRLDAANLLAGTEQQLANAAGSLDLAQLGLVAIDGELATQRRHIKREMARLRSTMADLEASYQRVIRAPTSGIVSRFTIAESNAVNAGDSLFAITPAGSSLEAWLEVPDRATGFIEEGQRVQLKLDAYPFQKFGTLGATVTSLTIAAAKPQSGNSVFIVKASLDRHSISAYGRNLPLKPDLSLTAEIELDNRTLLEWLIAPLTAMTGR